MKIAGSSDHSAVLGLQATRWITRYVFIGSGILDGTSKLGLTAHLIDSLVFCENSSHLTKIVSWLAVVFEAFDLAVDDIAMGTQGAD